MDGKEPAYFDLETVALLREVLDDAWASLRPEQQAKMLKTTLAERILKSAAHGERDRERLLDAGPDGVHRRGSLKSGRLVERSWFREMKAYSNDGVSPCWQACSH